MNRTENLLFPALHAAGRRIGALTFFLVVAAVVLIATAPPMMAQNHNIVVVAPHPDDEGLCCAGVIYNAVQQGYNVHVVVLTNGDYYAPGVPLGLQREAETVAAMALLGVPEQNVIFMGYGDETLQQLYQSTSPTQVITSQAGQSQTYANRGLGQTSYHQYLYGVPGPYNRQTLIGDMQTMLQNLQPTDIYTTGLWDDHPDHHSTFNFVVEALLALRKQGVNLSTRVHESLVHAPCAACGTAQNGNYLWPGGGQGISPVFTPTAPLPKPYYLENVWPYGQSTPYVWNQAEILPVPAAMQLTTQSANLKAQVIAQYYSQGGGDPNNWLFAFAKKDEAFWIRDFSTNVAGLATVTVSSQTPDTGQLGASAIDGFIEGYPGYAPWEWATQGQLSGAWITLTWPRAVTISQVVLYNRQNLVDDITSGVLNFSDGSHVNVGQLPITGRGTLISFSPRTVTSMQFMVNGATGVNAGLTEIEVFGKLANTRAGHPQIFQGPTASATYVNDQYGQQLYPQITDAQNTTLSVSAFDVDGFSLGYTWAADSGSVTSFGSSALFTPPVVASQTLVTAGVTVSDGRGGTAQNNMFISVQPSNHTGITASSLSLNPSSVASGSASVATVRLNTTAPSGAVLSLSSSNPSVASVPATVTVRPGSSSATFQVNTTFVTQTTQVTISATLGTTAQAVLTVLQPAVSLSSFTLNPTTVGGGNPATGSIVLSGPAPAGGAAITLSSGSPSVATVPASVTVPAGQTGANFTVTTQPVTSAVVVTLSASYSGRQINQPLRVSPAVLPNLASLATVTVSSETPAYQQLGIKAVDGIVDGSPGDYTKEWATNGQLAGAWITLTWNTPVTISEVDLYDRPNLTDNVTAGTLSFSDLSTVNVGTLPNNGTILPVAFSPRTVTSMKFTVTSAVGQNIGLAELAVIGTITTANTITGVTLNPATLNGGSSSTGTVTLNGVAPAGGVVVALASSNPSIASVPASVTVPSGATSANFSVTTNPVSMPTAVTISGTFNGTQTATLVINPVSISSLILNPNMVTGGTGTSTGTVTLNAAAPAGGAVVTLASSATSVASVPPSVTVPAQATSATFTITTTAVSSATPATISATYNGTQSAVLWVTPVISGGGMQQFVTDTFNRPDGSLGPNWSTILDSPSVATLLSQQVQSPWVYSTALYYGGINWPADQYAQVQVLQSNGGSSGPAVRMTSNGNYYAATVGSLGNGTASVYIILDSGGNRSIIASSSTATVMPNDYLQLAVQGSTLTMTNVTRSLTLLTITDATLQFGYPGLYVGSGGIVANWSAGLNTAPLTLSTAATDNFNRPNSPNLGANWTVGPGYFAIQILNNQIESAGQGQPPGTGHGKEYYTATPFVSDQWSQAQVISSTNDVNGAIVRYQGSVDTHYVGFVSMLGQPGTCRVTIDRDIAGSPAVLASDSTFCSVSSGDYVRLQAQGSLLTFVDVTTGALLLTTVDNQITGGSPGWSLSPNGGTPTAANWSGGGFTH